MPKIISMGLLTLFCVTSRYKPFFNYTKFGIIKNTAASSTKMTSLINNLSLKKLQ